MTHSFIWSISFTSDNTHRTSNPFKLLPHMFIQRPSILLCHSPTYLNVSSLLLAHILSVHLTPFFSKISYKSNSFLSYNLCIKNSHGVEGSVMDSLKLVKTNHKRKSIKMEVEESEENPLSSWQRYFRKMGSNLDGLKAGLAFRCKIKAIFWESYRLKLIPLEIKICAGSFLYKYFLINRWLHQTWEELSINTHQRPWN